MSPPVPKPFPPLRGFTLMEMLAVLVIASLLSALGIAGLTNLVKRSNLANTVALVQGSLKEAQRQAMLNSRPCQVVLGISSITTECPPGTLTRRDQLSNWVRLSSDITTPTPNVVSFSYRGTVSNNCPDPTNCGTIRIEFPDEEARCLRVESLLGKVSNDFACE
ncbi:pilus assembly FimT family protein [Thermostichus vulcanus]|uniref:Type II secretion system protein n=1 Tax=Thermostichus vulcanus str. 'Rupite' TaxID=2813851 RepID=A0ABT0C6V5_THEVL|nr:type II secretion system protein [Thermostichus vulcanus]MCJ2541437.1 type II secretion system protein [Thermostichus vulcanus str. 'Rupite']